MNDITKRRLVHVRLEIDKHQREIDRLSLEEDYLKTNDKQTPSVVYAFFNNTTASWHAECELCGSDFDWGEAEWMIYQIPDIGCSPGWHKSRICPNFCLPIISPSLNSLLSLFDRTSSEIFDMVVNRNQMIVSTDADTYLAEYNRLMNLKVFL